jgi:hypothetical protein
VYDVMKIAIELNKRLGGAKGVLELMEKMID